MEEIRLQKYLAAAGVASRRKCEEFILQGRVEVNGSIITELGTRVIESDQVKVDGKSVKAEENKIYIMLNKPSGYVTTAKDQFSRKTVLDLIEGIQERIYPVGRLDYDTSGLLLLTNDGSMAFKLTHPGHEVKKVYHARVIGKITDDDVTSFKNGVIIDEEATSPARLTILEEKTERSLVEIEIHEGKNRQVRKMCEAIGHPAISLKRVSVGTLSLGNLPEGQWRYLKTEELENITK